MPPLMYVLLRDRAGAPADLSEIADRDPRLEERVRNWTYAIGLGAPESKEGVELEWLRRHPCAGAEQGRRKALEGVLLLNSHRTDEAEHALVEARAILGEDEEVQRGLAMCHLAVGQFDRALTDLGSAAVPERPLALAAFGRIRDAYQALIDKRDISSAGEAKAAADATAMQIMDRLVLEIEKDQLVRNALSSEFGHRMQKADLQFEAQFGWAFHAKSDTAGSPGIESRPTQSIKMGLDYVLPPDPLSLLALLQSIADSPGDNAKPADVEHLATFVKRLSSFVREVVSEDARK